MRMSSPRARFALLALGVAVGVTGCAMSMSDLEAYVAEVKARPGPPLDPLPTMKPYEKFVYAAQDLRDPFIVPKEEKAPGAGSTLRPDDNRRKELLESFPLDGIDMVGTLGEDGGMVALVLDPEQVVHRVTVGNYLGQNDGKIVAITENRIDLVETVSDGAGGWVERQASVALDDE